MSDLFRQVTASDILDAFKEKGIKPLRGYYGLDGERPNGRYNLNEMKGCCGIGILLLGQSVQVRAELFGIKDEGLFTMGWDVDDDSCGPPATKGIEDNPSFIFGRQAALIVFAEWAVSPW